LSTNRKKELTSRLLREGKEQGNGRKLIFRRERKKGVQGDSSTTRKEWGGCLRGKKGNVTGKEKRLEILVGKSISLSGFALIAVKGTNCAQEGAGGPSFLDRRWEVAVIEKTYVFPPNNYETLLSLPDRGWLKAH